MRGLVVIALLALCAPARADDAPWAAGVTDDQKQHAQALLDQGNAQFLDRKYPEALATYQQALAVWDHPAIRFNLVRCLIQLGRPLEAYDDLEVALKYGKAPLEESVYEEALGYQALLEGEIATIEIRCDAAQTGARVSLDGKPVITCPGGAKERYLAGPHQVVAQRAGFLTMTKDLIGVPGTHTDVDVTLAPIEIARMTVRRWRPWKPWAAVGGAGAIAVAGGILEWRASADYGAYDRAVAATCGTPGCASGALPASIASIEHRARTENRIAIGGLAVGGAALAAGAVLVYLDRERIEMPELEVAPTSGGVSASITLRF
jgi:tetratricopeptide (TPR) repeat protein